jgi:hypothetical protein
MIVESTHTGQEDLDVQQPSMTYFFYLSRTTSSGDETTQGSLRMLGVRDVQKLLGILPSGSMLASHTNLLRSRQKDTRERENDIFRGLKAFKRGKKANARVSNRSKQTKPCLCSLLGSLSSQLNLGAQQPERERERGRGRERNYVYRKSESVSCLGTVTLRQRLTSLLPRIIARSLSEPR